VERLAALACGEALDTRHVEESRWLRGRQGQQVWGLEEDPDDLATAGWGVVFPRGQDPALRQALEPLLALRRQQAGNRYQELIYDPGPPPESKPRFLARHGAGPGPVVPTQVPYYLLLVGDPVALPFWLQAQLDLQYAVGRLCFETPQEYARYADTVVRAEDGEYRRPRRATLFGVRTEGDPATEGSHDQLICPLAATLTARHPDWTLEALTHGAATRARLRHRLTSPEAPALLFTASHGMGFPADSPLQARRQGALLCQDWPGPGTILPEHYLTGDDLAVGDLANSAGPQGLVAFFFACFSAGTPRHNSFRHRGDDEPQTLAPRPFVAPLPQRLLAHPGGGALAVIGQVDRAWSHAYHWPEVGSLHSAFTATTERLLSGDRLGWATEPLGQRHGELTADLHQLRADIDRGLGADHMTLAALWTACNDARGLIVLGDPAVRLVAEGT
jgi:hypothetical protein